MNKKIVIPAVALMVLIGGVLVWQYLVPKEEIRVPEKVDEVIKDETADWKTYRNKDYGFEIKYPGELEARWYIINKETTNGCVTGEQVRFYFYTKREAPPLKPGWGIGGYLFSGYLTSADYRELEISTKDGSPCGPVFSPVEKITLEVPFQLFSTSLTVSKPIQSMSCRIHQTAEFSVGEYYDEKYNTFELQLYHYDFPLLSAEEWRTECPKIFQENIQELGARIKQFDLIAKSLRFF